MIFSFNKSVIIAIFCDKFLTKGRNQLIIPIYLCKLFLLLDVGSYSRLSNPLSPTLIPSDVISIPSKFTLSFKNPLF